MLTFTSCQSPISWVVTLHAATNQTCKEISRWFQRWESLVESDWHERDGEIVVSDPEGKKGRGGCGRAGGAAGAGTLHTRKGQEVDDGTGTHEELPCAWTRGSKV